jgi:hypothetical protein
MVTCQYCWDTHKVWPVFGPAERCRRCPPTAKIMNVFVRLVFQTRGFEQQMKRVAETMAMTAERMREFSRAAAGLKKGG